MPATNKHKKHHASGPWKYIFSILFFVLAASISGSVLYLHSKRVSGDIDTLKASSESFTKEVNASIDRLVLKRQQIELAKQTAQRVMTDPFNLNDIDPYSCNRLTEHSDPSQIDVIVNKKHSIRPLGFEPTDLTTVKGATISRKAASSFESLINAAKADGQSIGVSSSYRSYSKQVSTYRHWVSIDGNDGADEYSARPGYSEHQTGLAIDVSAPGCTLDCFGKTSQYKWMQLHAAEYGFIQRYYADYKETTGYKAEEWHYRYVGKEIAQDMKSKDIMTLEAYWGIEGGNYF